MIVYGRNPVREALRGRRRVRRVWATGPAATEPWLRSVEVVAADAAQLERLCGSPAHQGMCAEADPYPYAEDADLLAGPQPFLIALDEVQDPQNLGAVCRSAECAGATGVVICERRSAGVTPAACRASAGAVEHLRIARTRNLADFLQAAKAAGCWCYGAAAGAPTRYDSVDWSGPLVLVLGSEGRGLRRRVAATCDALVSIPLRGTVPSLNVAAAAAVLAFEAARGRMGG